MGREVTVGLWGVVVVGVALTAMRAAAQPRVEPGETQVRRGGEEARGESGDGEEAEQPKARPGVEQFDVTKRRVRPDELPPPSATETDIPDVLRNNGGKLPAPPTAGALEATGKRVQRRVFELVSIQQPEAPGESSPIVHRGHAVLVGGSDDRPPILLSTYYWLEKTERLFLVPRRLSSGDGGRNAKPTAEHRSLDEMTVDGKAHAWLEAHRDDLVRARLYKPDEHRNLVTVVPDEPSKLRLPDRGLELFELEQKSPTRLYGFTPRTGKGLQRARLLESHPDEKSLVYYLQTTWSAVFGAPIVSTDGELLVLTAFKHPKISERVLVVPPKPIAAYVGDVWGTLE